jgi:hypothetical protein
MKSIAYSQMSQSQFPVVNPQDRESQSGAYDLPKYFD